LTPAENQQIKQATKRLRQLLGDKGHEEDVIHGGRDHDGRQWRDHHYSMRQTIAKVEELADKLTTHLHEEEI
jgi:hypothetical protein